MTHPNDIKEYDWESLVVGQTVRIHCSSNTCDNKKDSLTITRLYNGAIYNCFRCPVKGFVSLVSSPALAKERLKHIGKQYTTASHKLPALYLPKDFINLYKALMANNNNIPQKAYAYHYKYELNNNDFINYNIGYSNISNGIIYPIYNFNCTKLKAYLIRYIYGTNKYKLITKYNIYNIINNNRIIYYLNNNNKILVLCEDIISAIKIFNTKLCDVIALLNTSVPQIDILKKYDKIILWLDYDAKIKSLKSVANLQLKGYNISSIRTLLDPKKYTYTEIRNELSNSS